MGCVIAFEVARAAGEPAAGAGGARTRVSSRLAVTALATGRMVIGSSD
jgi:hypothetical protein